MQGRQSRSLGVAGLVILSCVGACGAGSATGYDTRRSAQSTAVCPAVGEDTDCGLIITITDTGANIALTGQPPFDGDDDTLVGVVNKTNRPIVGIGLRSWSGYSVPSPFFSLDGDGLTKFGVPGNFRDPTGYGGPNAYFSANDPSGTTSVVHFILPIPPGGTDYFALENVVGSTISCRDVINGGLSAPVFDDISTTVTFTPNGFSLADAAVICGFRDFDWQQWITHLPAPSPYFQVGNPTTPLTAPPPFLDPPPGGYRLHGKDFPSQSYPFYYTFYALELLDHQLTPSTLEFFDDPQDPCLFGGSGVDCDGNTAAPDDSFVSFTTHLAGVGVDGSATDLGIGFSWKTTNNGTSGGTATLKNELPPDPGTNTGRSTLVSIQTESGYQYSGITVTSVNDIPVPMSVASLQIKPPAAAPVPINPRSAGVIPVAILSTSTLAAADIDPASVRFGPSNALNVSPASLQDIDGDGRSDLILHFRTQDTGLDCSSASALLTGRTLIGQTFAGSEEIATVGCK
jgi:hypothetical protein